jgi:glycerol uptake facilitator-like aquaporin
MTTPSSPVAILAEFLGTFALVTSIFVSGGNALVIGGTLALIVFALGSISGANVNPAVSLAAFMNGSMTVGELIVYIAVQMAGGGLAAAVYKLMG